MKVHSKYLYRINLILLAIVFLNTVIVIVTGGYRISLGFLTLSSHSAEKSLLLLVALALLIRVFFLRKAGLGQEKTSARTPGTEYHLSGAKIAAVLLLILVAVFGVYHKTVNAFFVSDDFEYLSLFRTSHGLSFDSLFGFMKGSGLIRPVALASKWLGYILWGFDPRGYHLMNLLLHAANSFLVFLILYSLRRKYILSAFGALLFAVYPVHQEAVAWISGRADLLCGFFSLLALYLYLLSRKESARQSAYASLSLVAFLLALGSKEIAITLPLAIILLDCLVPHEGKRWRLRKMKFYVPYFVMLAGYIALRIIFLGNLGGYLEEQRSFFRLGPGFFYDLRNLVTRPFAALAVPLNRAVFANPDLLRAGFLLLIATVVTLLALRKRKISPLIGLGASLTVIAVLPAFRILFVSADMQGSRHLYLAALGAAMIIAGAAESLYSSSRRIIPAWPVIGSFIFLGFLTGISYVQTTPWVRAADLSKKIVEDGSHSLAPVRPGTTVYVLDLPDNVQGAYVFRNGFPSAMHLAGISDDVHIVELRKISPSEIVKRDANLVLQWRGTEFSLSEWTFDQMISAAKKGQTIS
jgi:hypothetical protein